MGFPGYFSMGFQWCLAGIPIGDFPDCFTAFILIAIATYTIACYGKRILVGVH